MPREITYGSRKFDDPGPHFTAAEIQTFLASLYPEIGNAELKEDAKGNISFHVKAGVKGS